MRAVCVVPSAPTKADARQLVKKEGVVYVVKDGKAPRSLQDVLKDAVKEEDKTGNKLLDKPALTRTVTGQFDNVIVELRSLFNDRCARRRATTTTTDCATF